MMHGHMNVELVLMLFVTYPSKNIALKKATKGGQNMQEVYISSAIISCYLHMHFGFIAMMKFTGVYG